MKAKGKLIFKSEDAGELIEIMARSLVPDNLSENITVIDENTATINFASDKIGTILSSVDDYLMNANIASDIHSIMIKNKSYKSKKTY